MGGFNLGAIRRAALLVGLALLVCGIVGCGERSLSRASSVAPSPKASSEVSSTTGSSAYSLPARLPASAKAVDVPILMYHYVDSTPPPTGPYSAGLTVNTARFEAEMNYLADDGYHAVTLEQIYAAMAGEARLPAKPVAITFDDGGLDDYTVAFPILRAHHLVATFFVITGFVGKTVCVSWPDVKVMHASGMEIESHTVRHDDLTTLPQSRLAAELSDSRNALIRELNEDPIALAYPSGAFNQSVEVAARKAGYLLAVTTKPGRVLSPTAPYDWPRLRVASGLSLAGFERLVDGNATASRTTTSR